MIQPFLGVSNPSPSLFHHLDTSASLGGANAASDVTEIPEPPVLARSSSKFIKFQSQLTPTMDRKCESDRILHGSSMIIPYSEVETEHETHETQHSFAHNFAIQPDEAL